MEREDINVVEEAELEEAEALEELEEWDEEEDPEEFEDEEPQGWMIALVVFGVIMILAVVIGIIFVFAKTDKNTKEAFASSVETEMDILEEETHTDEHPENETATMETEVIPEVETEDTTEVETAIQEESIVEPEETSEEVIVTEEVVLPEEESYMEFSDISDVVTAKDVTNLRLTPSTLDDKNIVSQLKNGENVERIGINEASGWSRVEYNGESLYVVSSMIYSTEG